MARIGTRRCAGSTDPPGFVRALGPYEGDADAAFTALFAAEYTRMVRTVYLVVHDRGHAEEIAQDAFLELLGHWEQISKYEQPGAWVRRIAIRMAVRSVRRERMRSLLERRTQPVLEAVVEQPVLRAEVFAVVRGLPTNQRVAVVLHYFEDRPVAEIAYALGCAEATARVHLFKARQRLASLLDESGDDDVAG